MSTVTDPTPDDTTSDGAGRDRTRLVILVVFGLLFGLLGARFLLAGGPGDGDLPPVAPAAQDADERLDRLRADVDRNPNSLQAWQEIASLSIAQAATTGDPAYYPQARQALDQAEELAPDDVANDVLRGNLELALHEFGDAAMTARDILDQQPGNLGGLTVLTDAQVELGRYDAAAETLQELLDRRPSLPALARTSYLRELNGDLDGAVQAMSQAVQAGAGLTSPLANVTNLLGDLQLRAGRLDAAAESYDRALAIVDGYAPALTGQARLRARTGDVDGAIAQLQEVTDRTPYPGALTLLAELQEFAGDREAADATAEVLRAVTALQEEAGQVVDLELADFEAATGDAERAFDLAQDVYAARPTIFAASALGWSLQRLEESSNAARYARESLELGSLDPVLNYRAAEVLAGVDPELASAALGRAFAHDPSGTFRHREDLVELAEELEVEVPQTWQQAEVGS